MGVGKNSVNGNQFGDFGNGKGTSNSANFGNGDYRVNGSIGTSSVPSLHRTSIPKSGFEPFGAIGASPAIVAPVPLSPLASGFSEGPAAPKSVIPTGAPEYSYVSNASDIGTGNCKIL
ncbi:unnamed protein product [Allacma fusca]|uniref:Uncharacterized protein n=1 Tax=Allacma fusca TaxID=39272 RepID=A0A8J2KBM5_9HEXA|nr:unnamed protein product [Allacma fusca]